MTVTTKCSSRLWTLKITEASFSSMWAADFVFDIPTAGCIQRGKTTNLVANSFVHVFSVGSPCPPIDTIFFQWFKPMKVQRYKICTVWRIDIQ